MNEKRGPKSPGVIELPMKPRNTRKLSSVEVESQERERKLLPARAASRYAEPVNCKRGRFGLPWWLWPAR
jgi:hypothetical protein